MQTTLTDTDDEPPTEKADRATNDHTTISVGHNLAPPEQRGEKGCCPWCLASEATFERHGDGQPRCGHCDAAIPVGTDWYERGEKIVL